MSVTIKHEPPHFGSLTTAGSIGGGHMNEHDWHRPMEDSPYCDVQLPSLPPMYEWTCSKCGAVAYCDCREGEPPSDGCTAKNATDEVRKLVE